MSDQSLKDEKYDLVFPYNGFHLYNLVAYQVPLDNNCFFHSIMLGIIKEYRNCSNSDGLPVDRYSLVMGFRKTLSELLDQLYDKLSRGALREYSNAVPEYNLENLKKTVKGANCVGLEVLELTSIVLDINIVILDVDTLDVYMTGDHELLNSRNSGYVILLYNRKRVHYELVGLKTNEGNIVTYFNQNHSLIKHIKDRISILSKPNVS